MASEGQYIVSARKYRPGTFDSVVGQHALTSTLKNAILSGKLAQAYLFCGPRGVGKTSCARIFAKTINCEHPTADGEACGECESCRAIERGNSFNLVELDAASNNSVDNIRSITEQVNVPPQTGRYRVFIIDEVHMLTNQAFNAFLKTLEEPPKNVVFILATTERHKVIPTILSRCQVYDFRRISINDMVDHLEYVARKEDVKADREALGVIALKADGAMRDALSVFDQVVASTHGNLTYQGTIDALNVLDQEYYFKLVDIFREGDVGAALLILKEITDKGFDAQFFINGLAEHIRNLMVSADPRTVQLLETSEERANRYKAQAPQLPVEWYYSAMKILNDTDFNYRTAGNKRLLVELALIRLCRLLMPLVSENNKEGAGAPFVRPAGDKPQPAPEKKTEADQQTKPPTVNESKIGTQAEDKKTPHVADKKPARLTSESSRRPSSFRLTVEKQKETSNPEGKEADRAYTPEDLRQVWEEYINSHPEQRILVSAMRSGWPEHIRDHQYLVRVNHPAQKQAFETALQDLVEFLRGRLGNVRISLGIEISDTQEDAKMMPPKEFLKMAIKENDALAKFLKDIDAELEQ